MVADPKTSITPTAFTVAPEILGYALARPTRRLAAIAVDFVLAAIIARTPLQFLVAAAAGLFAWRWIAGPVDRLIAGRGRLVFRAASAVLALIIVVNIWRIGQEQLRRVDGDNAGPPPAAASPGDVQPPAPLEGIDTGEDMEIALDEVGLTGTEKAAFLLELAAVQMADDDAAAERGAKLGNWLLAHTEPGERRDQLSAALADAIKPSARQAFNGALGIDSAAAASPEDSLALARAEAGRLRQRNQELRGEIEALENRKGGVKAFLAGITDDLGLGFGWFTLYFTAFTVLGRGQTPGKRMLGIRVLRLDNRPLSWWLSFERFGGYAASFSTGLLGFAQILWDPNRQSLHDKAVGTVVIRLQDGQPIRVP